MHPISLTLEQRQLLGVYPSALISDTVVDPERGITNIRNGCCGGTRHGGPEWLERFDTHHGRIEGGQFGEEPSVTVTFTQLRNWARGVPADLRERIRTVREAEQAEAHRVWKWCQCHHGDPERAAACVKANEGDPLWGGRHHPSDAEYEAHLVIVFDLRDQERELLDEVLGLGDEPVGQMDLFDLIGDNA